MKKISIYMLASILLYSLFRELNIVKVLYICLGLASIYAIYRAPSRYIIAMKYPIILLSFAGTAGFFLYPELSSKYPIEAVIVFLSFYSITFYLITIEEKGKDFFKDVIALSLLFLSSSFNLFMIGKPLLILPISLSIMLFLFIVGKNRIIPIIAGYTLFIMVFLYHKGINILGAGIRVNDIDRYLLLISSFAFLLLGFIDFMKKDNLTKVLYFFGFLYVAIDILMVLGIKLSGGLLYQPVILLFIIIPLIGVMLKAEGEHV